MIYRSLEEMRLADHVYSAAMDIDRSFSFLGGAEVGDARARGVEVGITLVCPIRPFTPLRSLASHSLPPSCHCDLALRTNMGTPRARSHLVATRRRMEKANSRPVPIQ